MKNLRLSLYAFHLYQTLDEPPDTVNQDGANLWESLTNLAQFFPFPELQTLKSQLISYSPDQEGKYQYNPQREDNLANEWLTHHGAEIEFTSIPTNAGFQLGGNLQPFRLHDTYCVDITLYPEIPDLGMTIDQLSAFNPKALIEGINANLGKVIWLTGENHYFTKPKPTEAQKWVNALCAGTNLNPQFIDEDKLFNCPLFRFEAQNLTLLVSFAKPKQADLERANQDYSWFRDLLWSYQKITFAYQEARACYKKSRLIYGTLETKVQEFYAILNQDSNTRVYQLDALLKAIPENVLYYNCYLRDLKSYYTTIAANKQNLQTCLNYLLTSGDTLKTWSAFTEQTCPRYLTQIQTYIDYLEPGKDLFSDLINTIRATAAIEQSKRDKELQDNIQAVGVGIAAGAILSSSTGFLMEPWRLPSRDNRIPHPFIISFFGSFILAFVTWKLAKWWIKRRRFKH
ncbi:MAG: hypothetical protein RH949_27505 [Coleofasciculus sp. A1-SPW-01]|uniref:hypothetical protein n=1 Tax=Coleofasciculus sp. A1-SPW-01 TaxID=3070819 RepID=UPI0032F7DAD0